MKDEIKEFIEFRTDEDGTYFYYNDKDNIEQWSYKLDDLKDYITNLQEENKMLIEVLEINHKIIDKYVERIDKAIEYIGNGNIGIPRKTRNKFINILQGDDKK